MASPNSPNENLVTSGMTPIRIQENLNLALDTINLVGICKNDKEEANA